MKGSKHPRFRPSENTSQSFEDNSLLHSTAIEANQGKRPRFDPSPPCETTTPVTITAPSGFPVFSAVLQQHGYIIAKPRNTMAVDQLVFRKRLSDWIQEKRNEEPQASNDVTKFISAMNGYLTVNANLAHSVTPTLHPDEVFQASLLHNLLCIASLQSHVVKILLPVLAESAYTASSQEEIDKLVSILTQMKWLPNVAEMPTFAKVLLDMVENATPLAQKEMVRFLPDIIPEKQHSKVASALKRMLDSGSEVVSSLMDCFSSLDISEREWDSIREAATIQMFSAQLQDFPAYFAFLFRTEDPMALGEIIAEMREKLELIPFGNHPKNAAYMVEIVEKIRFCSSVNPHLVSIWSKQVKDNLTSDGEAKALDFIMLLIFAESFKPPLVPLKMILYKHRLAANLLTHVLEHNMPMINQVFPTLAKICDSFLRGKEVKAQAAIEHIYVKLFLAVGPIEAQEIAANLTSVLLNGYTTSREPVLRILTAITQENAKKLLILAPHIMSILEGVMKYPPHLIRQLMSVLATLSYIHGNPDSERFGAEFAIFLRKQLTHTNMESRCFGVLGAFTNVLQLSKQPYSQHNADKIRELMESAWSFVNNEEEPCGIFFDEFSNVVQYLPAHVRHYFRTILEAKFIESWTVSSSSCSNLRFARDKRSSLKLSPTFDASKNSPAAARIIIFEEKSLGMSPRVIPAHLRLIALLVKTEATDMASIEFLLGCPLLLPDLLLHCRTDNLAGLNYSQKYALGHYLTLSINYLRECISAFSDRADPDVSTKIWFRLWNVVCLQKILSEALGYLPRLQPAYVAGKVSINERKPEVKQGIKKPAKSKKGKSVCDNAQLGEFDGPTGSVTAASVAGENYKDLENCVQPASLVPFLRRFDIGVFHMLDSPLTTGPGLGLLSSLPDDISDRRFSSGELYPETLALLLLEIIQQNCDSDNAFSILSMKNITLSLCTHMDVVMQFLKDLDSETSEPNRKLDDCYRLLLRTLNCQFQKIKEILDEEAKECELRQALEILGSRKDVRRRVSTTQADLIQRSVNYLGGLSEVANYPATAVEHLKLLSNFEELVKTEHAAAAVDAVAEKYLKAKWKLSSSQADFILKTWITKSADPLGVLQYVTESLTNPVHGGDIPCTDTFQSCTPGSFNTWYQVLFSSLSHHVSKQGKEVSSKGKSTTEAFAYWMRAVAILRVLVNVTHTLRKNKILSPLLRYSRVFLEAWISHGINLLPAMCADRIEDFKTFTHNLQNTTRKLQTVCEHSKVKKDTQLMRHVPLVKRVLEALVFRVREVLAINGVSEAFWMGSLRHRNLDGEVVNSQPFNDLSEEETSDTEEQVEPDDRSEVASSDSDD